MGGSLQRGQDLLRLVARRRGGLPPRGGEGALGQRGEGFPVVPGGRGPPPFLTQRRFPGHDDDEDYYDDDRDATDPLGLEELRCR